MNLEPQNRREFLQASARAVLLGGLGVLGLSLFRRESLTDPCINNEVCLNCRRHTDCALPPAVSYREGQGKGNDHG